MDKLLKIIGFCILPFMFVGLAYSKVNVEYGSVKINGRIFDTPCNIDPESQTKSLELGVVPLDAINVGTETIYPFSIQLVNCSLTSSTSNVHVPQYFQISFDGENQNNNFAVQGQARGIALEIKDSSGNSVYPGKILPVYSNASSTMKLDYSLRVVKSHEDFRVGGFSSTIKFKLDYY